MSFLSSTATIDAILTKKGRELLSAGEFDPTKFALADDEIDYGLLSQEDGEAQILNTRILEANSLGNDANTQLRYKLIISEGQLLIPQLSIEPNDLSSVVYDILEVRLTTTDGGTDDSYTVVNNSQFVTIDPYRAIFELNKQTYIAQSGKKYQQILNQLNILKGIYGNVPGVENRPIGQNQFTYPESFITRPVGADGSHKFFVFAYTPTALASKLNISGNNSGAVAEFQITKVDTTIQIIHETD